MEAKIKEVLKAAGLDENLWTLITVTNESEIEAKVKTLQGELDRRVTSAIKKTADDKLLAENKKLLEQNTDLTDKVKTLTEQGGSKDGNKDDKGGNTDNLKMKDALGLIEKVVKTAVEPLQQEITSLKTGNATDKLTVQAKKLLKDEKLSATFLKYLNVNENDTEETLKEKIAGVKTDFVAKKQEDTNENLNTGKPIIGDGDPSDVPKNVLMAFANRPGNRKYAKKEFLQQQEA